MKRSGPTSWLVFGCSIATVIALPNNPNGLPSASHYSVNQHVSFDPKKEQLHVAAETETMAFYNPVGGSTNERIEEEKTSDDSLQEAYVSSSYISMQDRMYQLPKNINNSNPHVSLNLDLDYDFSEFEDSDEDSDDDDDDDDGHSMMLSNASLRKSIALVSGSAAVPVSFSDDSNSHSKIARPNPRRTKAKQPSASSYSVMKNRDVLSVRGGGVVADPAEFAKRLVVAALVTLMYEACIGHFLEFVKIVMQTSPSGTTYLDVLRTITSEKGIAGIWDGFVPWGVVQSIGKGGVFGLARAVALSILMPLVDEGKISNLFGLTLAGGIAGGFQGYVLSPTLLLKTRVMTNPVFREKMSMLQTTLLSLRIGLDVVTQEGIGALMKGSNVFALKRVFDWSTRFYFSDIFKNLIQTYFVAPDTTITAGQRITADLLGGTASTLCTLPLDVLVAKSQDAKKAGVKVSALDMFKEELKEKGAKGLYDSYMRGFEARLLHVCFTTVAMKTGTGLMYDFLFKKD